MKPTLAIDWDGTLVQSRWPEQTQEWMPGAVEALHALTEYARIVIYTCRIAPVEFVTEFPRPAAKVQGEINYIRQMLDDAGLSAVAIHTDPWKPYADAYVDDKAVHYRGRPNSWRNLVDKLAAICGETEEVA